MVLTSKQNELWSCATSQIAEDGKTILNLSYFFKIDCDLPKILYSKAARFFISKVVHADLWGKTARNE